MYMKKEEIEALVCHIRENLWRIENGDTSDCLFDEVERDFREFLGVVKIIMLTNRDSYYGCFLMNICFRLNFSSSEAIRSMVDDFRVVFEINPIILFKYKVKEILYLMCHEIDHLVYGHMLEKKKLAENGAENNLLKKFDIASDTEINEKLDFEAEISKNSWLMPPKERWNSQNIEKVFELKDVKSLQNYKYYLDLLCKSEDESDNEQEIGQESDVSPIETDSNDFTDEQDEENIKFEDKQGNDEVTPSHNWNNEETLDNTEATLRNFLCSGLEHMDENQRGILPKNAYSIINSKDTKPVLSWKKLLKNYIGTITANKRKTRTRLNRRQPERYDLSGTMESKVLKIVVAIDTSGSVNDEQISQIFTEIFSIVSGHKNEITVIECDAEIQRVYRIRKKNDLQKSVKGRGGTAFTPVIEYVNNNRNFRDALLIYFTDGFGEFRIPVPKTYRNLWVILGKAKNLSLENAYGRVVAIENNN